MEAIMALMLLTLILVIGCLALGYELGKKYTLIHLENKIRKSKYPNHYQ